MSTCPSCHQRATKRDGYDAAGRQRYHCRPCRRDFTAHSASAFSGYRWPPDVILMAVRWYCSLPLSAAQVVRLLAERNIDVSARTVLNWVQTFGPQIGPAGAFEQKVTVSACSSGRHSPLMRVLHSIVDEIDAVRHHMLKGQQRDMR